MFKKKCGRCGRGVSKEFDFCPYCGNDFRTEKVIKKEEDYGLLGRDDFVSEMPNFSVKLPLGLDKMFNSLLSEMTQQIEHQFKELDKKIAKPAKFNEAKRIRNTNGISISISSASGKKPEIKVKAFGPGFDGAKEGIKEAKIEKPKLSDEDAKRLAKLPRKEAEANVRRLSNRIVYEINLPEVKSFKDVIINKLENSVEIKAFASNIAYFKLIPLNLPILNYKLKDEKLIIEFEPNA